MTGERRAIWGWALYDWANSAFALIVLTAVYPVFFGRWFAAGMTPERSTFWLGLGAAGASLVVAGAAPWLGAWANRGHRRRLGLGLCLGLGVTATAGLGFLPAGAWRAATACYMAGSVGFFCANLFYDALLPVVSGPANRHRVSALGFAMGYLGSVLLLAALLPLLQYPTRFGLASPAEAARVAFWATAAWWVLFSLPLFRWVWEPAEAAAAAEQGGAGGRALLTALGEVWRNRPLRWFLLGFWLYNDGVNTIVKLAGKLGSDLGFSTGDLLLAIVLVQVVGVPCALGFGWVGQRWGARPALLAGLGLYLLTTLYAGLMPSTPFQVAGRAVSPVYGLALLIGLVQGGVQSLSRSYFASLLPTGRETVYFGLFNLVGKASAILGPLGVALLTAATGRTQAGILAIAPLFLLGAAALAWGRPGATR